tara:strand:- start:789 stop:917 length:129 start_codon:yes stop_codon:yes gene_type:complete
MDEGFQNLLKGYEVEIARLKKINKALLDEIKSLKEQIEKIEK